MGAVNHESKLVQTMAWQREDTKQLPESVVIQAKWCICESLGLIELITSLYWENISIRRKTVLFERTRDTFTPIAESGQFRPLRLGRGEGRVDHIL